MGIRSWSVYGENSPDPWGTHWSGSKYAILLPSAQPSRSPQPSDEHSDREQCPIPGGADGSLTRFRSVVESF
jgi:hypothetical protein